jgi:hypothetical protein
MRSFFTAGLFATLLFGLSSGHRAFAATEHDGNWTVLIITEKGDCDRGYRYAVAVANGQVSYRGDAAGINMSGSVTPAGVVKVSIRLGDKGAGANGASCAGRWEAERR